MLRAYNGVAGNLESIYPESNIMLTVPSASSRFIGKASYLQSTPAPTSAHNLLARPKIRTPSNTSLHSKYDSKNTLGVPSQCRKCNDIPVHVDHIST